MLFDALDEVFGRRSNVRLLRALSPIDYAVSGREAARLAGLSHRAIVSLDDLAALGVVHRRETAGQHLYSFNREHALAPAVLELFAAEHRRTTAILGRLKELAGAAGAAYAGVFGSGARGEAKPKSDLDVIVLVESPESRRAAYESLVAASGRLQEEFGVRLSPVVLTLDQAREQARERGTLMRDLVRDARRVHGHPLEELIGG
ncbi:MAG: nucleotidyltransferase domain-containing protein [Gemmatimonadetes bacterium]|nr:nucleotidyltransferase domain-containing protein [Gemmatimonadota bacterium]